MKLSEKLKLAEEEIERLKVIIKQHKADYSFLVNEKESQEKDFSYYNDYQLCMELLKKNEDLNNQIENLKYNLSQYEESTAMKTISMLKDHIVKLSMGIK